MIDLSQFPSPADAPEPGACIRVERPEEGLAVVVFDAPHRSFSVLDAPLLRDLDALLTELEGDASLKGVVFTGRRPDQFLAGGDVEAAEQFGRLYRLKQLHAQTLDTWVENLPRAR